MRSLPRSVATRSILVAASLAASTVVIQAAAIIPLSPLSRLSTQSQFNGDIDFVLNDPFDYDPMAPTSSLPDQTFTGGLHDEDGYHASLLGDAILTYDIIGGAIALEAGQVIAIDFYGRENCCPARDNDFDLELYYAEGKGSSGALVATLAGLGIPDEGPFWLRAYYTPAPGDLPVDRLRIVARDSDGGSTPNHFTLMELRAVVVPEPSSGLLALFGGALALRRRRPTNPTFEGGQLE